MGRIAQAAVTRPFISHSLVLFRQNGTRTTLDDLQQLIGSGDVTPAIDRTFPIGEVPAAVKHFAKTHAAGKFSIAL
jgi:NADPH:quinone reductase-like Zn-dependent oxidoreductase